MVEVTKKYDLGSQVIPMESLKVVDPGLMSYSEGSIEFYPLSDVAMRQLADILELPSKKFSSDLYDTDQDLWKQLVNKKMLGNNVKNSFSSKNALLINEEIINFFNGSSNLSQVLGVLNGYIEAEDLTSYLSVDSSDELVLISVDKDHVGNLIKYYFQDDYIVVYDCYYNDGILILAPYYAVDSAVSEDTYQIANKEVCYSSSSQTMPASLESYIKELKETFLSAEEVINMMKKYFKIKLQFEPIDPLTFGADNDYSVKSIECLTEIIDTLYSDSEFVGKIGSNYLKKSVYITGVSYYSFVKFMVSRFMDDNLIININSIRDVEFNCFQHKNHFSYLRG